MIDYEVRKEEVQAEIKRLESLLKVTKVGHLRKKIQREIKEQKIKLDVVDVAKRYIRFTELP